MGTDIVVRAIHFENVCKHFVFFSPTGGGILNVISVVLVLGPYFD